MHDDVDFCELSSSERASDERVRDKLRKAVIKAMVRCEESAPPAAPRKAELARRAVALITADVGFPQRHLRLR